MKFWLKIGSISLASISLFNFIQTYFKFGTGKVIGGIIDFYRSTFHPLVEIINPVIIYLFSIIKIYIDDINKEIVLIYIILGGVMIRSTYSVVSEIQSNNKILNYVHAIFVGLLWPMFLPLTILRHLGETLSPMSSDGERYGPSPLKEDVLDIYIPWLRDLAMVFVVFIFLYAINAFSQA
jgi:hypothetical protein